jgi:adenylate cyclase
LAEGNLPNALQGAHAAAPGANSGSYSGAVFISYASQDAAAAVRICDGLRSAGIEVWFDQSELRGGDAWDQTIRARIRDCTLFIPIISRHTQERLEGYFRREWKLAVNRTHDMAQEKAFLMPVVVDDTKPPEARVPEQFRGLQWTVIVDGNVSPSFVERVSDLLSAQGDTTSTNAWRRGVEGQGAPTPAPASALASRGGEHRFPFAVPFLESIKRRNVGRVAILYIIASYILLEGFELFYHLLDLPVWSGRLAVGLAVLGLPVVMAVASAYHITPEGQAASDQADGRRSIARQHGRRLNQAIVAVLLIALAYFAADKFWLSKQTALKKTADTAASDGKSPTVMPTTASEVPDRSIAVLPFLDMSEKHDQEYFADGLTEELIYRLSQSPDLKVIARTSSFHYKGRNDDVREIATALGVRHLLEGSVRKSGRQLRVTVQLMKASDGSNIWSDTYDKTAQDIFAVQQQIATAVTRRLNASMAGSGQADRARPLNFAAYELLLQGDSHRGFNLKDENARIDCYRRAIALEAGYALAWARLAVALGTKTQLVQFEEAAGLKREAEQAARHALQIDPNLADGYFALGWALNFEAEWGASEEAFRHANLLQPGIADRLLANLELRRTGNLSATIDVYRKLLERDPKYATLYAVCGLFLFDAGRFQESETMLRQLMALEPRFQGARLYLIQTLVFEGSLADALKEMASEDDPDTLEFEKVLIFWALGRRDESTVVRRSMRRDPDNLQIARLNAFRGETDEAFLELNKAVDAGNQLFELKYDRYFEPLRSDPRFAALLRKVNL